MNRQLIIGDRIISDDSDCYVIAEIGHNHQGSLKTAIELFKAAAECGVSAAKLQKRDNRALYTREMFDKPYENENSFGTTYGEHREALEFGKVEYEELQAESAKMNIAFFATAFDFKSADFLSVPSEIAFARPHGFDLAARTDDGHDIANLNAFILSGTDVHVVSLREHELLLLFDGADDALACVDRSFLNKSCAVKIVTTGDIVGVGRRSGNG